MATRGVVPTDHMHRSRCRPTENGWALNGGGDEEDRTPDLRIANATLSQLSYAPTRVRSLAGRRKPFGSALQVNDV